MAFVTTAPPTGRVDGSISVTFKDEYYRAGWRDYLQFSKYSHSGREIMSPIHLSLEVVMVIVTTDPPQVYPGRLSSTYFYTVF